MQNATTVLNVLSKRGARGLPVQRLYRQMFNPQLYLLAYGRLYANIGAMTPGVTPETADGMSQAKIATIIDAMRGERYRFKPVKRVYVPKRDGKKRPLGMPTWSDKLVGEVVRLLLQAYYEPQCSGRSHGFRPGRGCHTALSEIVETWKGTHWFIEGDVSDCFGSLDHDLMITILAEKIHDSRFLRLVRHMLQAGYLEDWHWHATLSGAPQGGIASPVLSNIYLDRFDRYVEQRLLPEYNHSGRRRTNRNYEVVENAIARARRRGDRAKVGRLTLLRRQLPSQDPNDPDYRRLRYIRYADDWLLGFAGPKHEAEQIKSAIAKFLHEELKLELATDKTLITHATSQAARFLGYDITAQHCDTKITGNRRAINAVIGLFVPRQTIRQRCALYMRHGKPAQRGALLHDDDFTIVAKYGAEYAGLIQYYLLAQDVFRLGRLRWVMETSMLKTLAAKHRSTVTAMARKYKTTIETPAGPRTVFQVTVERDRGRKPLVARFGGVPLRRVSTAVLADQRPVLASTRRNELIHRLRAGRCEVCADTVDLEVHHIRKLADLDKPGRRAKPDWMQLMAKRRRKTLVVCRRCHENIHAGHNTTPLKDHRRAV